MKFTIIDVEKHEAGTVSFEGIDQAITEAKLELGQVDHGVVEPGLGIVVHEYGLFADPKEMRYFSLQGKLYAGNAVLYGFDQFGETISVRKIPTVNWLDTEEDVELAIATGIVERPKIAVNSKVVWRWPQPQGER